MEGMVILNPVDEDDFVTVKITDSHSLAANIHCKIILMLWLYMGACIVDCFSLCLFLLLYLCFKVWGGVGAGPAEGRGFIFVIVFVFVFVFAFVFVLWCVWGGGGGVGAAEGRVWLWVRALPPRGVTCRGRYAHHHHIPTIPTNHNFMSIIIISMMATSFFFGVRIFQPETSQWVWVCWLYEE